MRIGLDSSILIAARISRAGVCAEMLEDILLHHELVRNSIFRSAIRIRSAPSFVELALLCSRPISRQIFAGILPMYRCWALRLPVNARS